MKNTGYVAVIDILGYKSLVESKPLEEIHAIYDKVLAKIQHGHASAKYSLDDTRQTNFELFFFSDTIIFAIDRVTTDAFYALLEAVQEAFVYLFDASLLARGGIAKGELMIEREKNIVIGKPLIDAYLLSEQLMFSGCVCHHSIEEDVKNILSNSDTEYRSIENYASPLKNGRASHLTIAYPYHVLTSSYKPNEYLDHCQKSLDYGIRKLTQLKFIVSGNKRVYYDNTIHYFESCLTNLHLSNKNS